MKKILPALIVVIIVAALWFAVSSRSGDSERKQDRSKPSASLDSGAALPDSRISKSDGIKPRIPSEPGEDEEDEDELMFGERPATEIYKSAEEALEAVKKAALDYDDLVLDQFTELPASCSWCESFYASLKDLLASPDIKDDQRSYYGELLAVSGRVDNIKTLVDGITHARNQEEAEIMAEALELSTGSDDVVKYLGEQLGNNNETLKEAAVAAITNQGSRLAVELLHKNTIERGDPDGYYSMGIGLGEVVPEEEALPYLQDLAAKRDAYSHLAVKSLLNAGLDGTKIVIDLLTSSRNPEFDRELLKGAKDHIAYDDDVIEFLRPLAESSQSPIVREFVQDVLKEFAQSQEEDMADMTGGQMAPMSPLNP